MLRRTHSPILLSNLTKEDERRTSQRANPMAKEVTLGVQPAIWNHQETYLPSRAERPHNFHPIGFDNCSEPIAGCFHSPSLIWKFYYPIGALPCISGTGTGRKIPCFLFHRLFNPKELITSTSITQRS